jgi:predicted ATPase
VELDPLLEANHRLLMRLLALSGQRRAALAQYEALRRILKQELDAEPDEDSVELHAVIELGTEAAPSLRQSLPAPGHLPAPSTRLVGRAADVDWICEQLRDSARLVTLTGAPGIGKTRLALQAAEELRYDFEDGVHAVELAALSDPALVPATIARALGVPERAGQTPAAALITALRHKHLLLVLDNFEHLLASPGISANAPTGEAHTAGFVAELLAGCSAVKMLITSRAPLRVRGEQIYPLAPLAEAEAVQLFAARAGAVRPGFDLAGENAAAVAEICRRLDGLPLAIELIASRARALSTAELLRQLEHGLAALDHGPRDVSGRHRTLRAAIAWSYERLSAGERHVFAHLGAFAGGATLAAIEAVCAFNKDEWGMMNDESGAATSPIPHSAFIIHHLEALVDSSLVTEIPGAAETRFSMLELIHQCALECLAANDQLAPARQRHLDYFLALAEQALPELDGPDQLTWFDRLEREHANLRAALEWSLERGQADTALRITGVLWYFWEIRGYLSEGRRWLEAALAHGGPPSPGRVQALRGAGVLALRQSDYEQAKPLLEEGLAVARQVNDKAAIAASLNYLGVLAEVAERDHAAARRLFEASLAAYEALDNKRGAGRALQNIGIAMLFEEDYGRAAALIEQGLGLLREAGEGRLIAMSLAFLGHALLLQGDDARAKSAFVEGLDWQQRVGDKVFMTYCLIGLGAVAARVTAGTPPVRAARLLGAAEALREVIGAPLLPSFLSQYERILATVRARFDEAAFAAAWAEGRALTLEEAVRLAISNL